MELNLNAAECIKAISNIGETTYRNICTGTEAVVPWGSADWFNGVGPIVAAAIVSIGFVWFVRALVNS